MTNHFFFPFRSATLTPSKVSIDIDNITSNSLHMRLVCQGTSSQRPPLHNFSSSSSSNIVDVMKLTKSRNLSKFDLITIDFDTLMCVLSSTYHHHFMMMYCLCWPM